MHVRILVGVNALLAAGLTAFIWTMLPFAHGVACDATPSLCTPLILSYRVFSAAGPGLALLAMAWVGAKLSGRKPGWGMLALVASPTIIAGWVVLVLVTSAS